MEEKINLKYLEFEVKCNGCGAETKKTTAYFLYWKCFKKCQPEATKILRKMTCKQCSDTGNFSYREPKLIETSWVKTALY